MRPSNVAGATDTLIARNICTGADGTAKLTAEPSSTPKSNEACRGGRCTYKAGLLSTARANATTGDYLFKFTYGYVESRFKFPATQGFFTAFWMLPAEPSFTYRTEIDILELLGDDPTTMFMTYHYNNRSTYFAANKGKFHLLVDMEKVEFLDSTGLGVLVGGLKRVRAHDGSLELVCTQERILKIFRITGLTKVFGIHDTIDEAREKRKGTT